MSGSTERWTTRDFELYHDGELDAPRWSELSESLQHDPELRDRFATARRVDAELRAAFLDERTARRHEPRTMGPFARPVLAAACLLIAVGLAWWFAPAQRSLRDTPLVQGMSPRESSAAAKPEYHSVRVVLSLPVARTLDHPTADRGIGPAPAAAHAAPQELREFLARLDRALVAGRIEDALDLLDSASEGRRTVAYRRFGQLLRSARVAEQILDRLSPQEQLAVCSLWAREPVVRPTVFERLRRFSMQPELSDDVRLVVAELAGDAELRPWLQGYQLVGFRAARKYVPG